MVTEMKNCNSCESCIAWWCDLYERFLDSDENGPLPCEECLEETKKMIEDRKMVDSMNAPAESVASFFNTLLGNGLPVDVAASLTGKMIESMILMSGKQDGGD